MWRNPVLCPIWIVRVCTDGLLRSSLMLLPICPGVFICARASTAIAGNWIGSHLQQQAQRDKAARVQPFNSFIAARITNHMILRAALNPANARKRMHLGRQTPLPRLRTGIFGGTTFHFSFSLLFHVLSLRSFCVLYTLVKYSSTCTPQERMVKLWAGDSHLAKRRVARYTATRWCRMAILL